MVVRFVTLLLAVAVAGVFGQTGLFGPVGVRLKAGDLAPDIVFTNVLNAPGSTAWTSASLSGHVTLLVFYPDTSHNLESVSIWNALVEQFAGKPVQFVWITAESESSLLPWLEEHPLKGWVFLDPNGQTGRSFGLEMPDAVIIGTDRRIMGFQSPFVPDADTLNAALEGRITSAPVTTPAQGEALTQSGKVHFEAEPERMPGPEDHKPNFPPSYTVHISPAQDELNGGNFCGMDYCSLEGYDLKTVIQDVYDVNPARVYLPASLDNRKRYDFALVLPEAESKEQMYERFRRGIQDYFHITATRENRLVEAYALTAANGKPPVLKARDDADPIGFGWFLKRRICSS